MKFDEGQDVNTFYLEKLGNTNNSLIFTGIFFLRIQTCNAVKHLQKLKKIQTFLQKVAICSAVYVPKTDISAWSLLFSLQKTAHILQILICVTNRASLDTERWKEVLASL